MTAATLDAPAASRADAADTANGRDDAQRWGLLFILPYVLIFFTFVLYPVLYGFWMARKPESYVKLAADPIYLRTIGNTLIFVIVAINVKMLIALVLSGFFTTQRWWIKALSTLFILPWARPSSPVNLKIC